MANAGTVTIDFAAETAKFTAELKKVRGDLKGLKEDTASISGTLGTAATAVKAFIAGWVLKEVISGIRAVVKATEESEAALAQLNSAIQTAGTRAQFTSTQFQDFATKLSQQTVFTDEAIQGIESLLLTFRGMTGELVVRATPAILDMATRMKIDVASAAALVGKALVGTMKDVKALANESKLLDAPQLELIKHMRALGDVAGANEIILNALKTSFGGAAVGARDTFGGALQGLHNDLGELLEAKTGLPAATKSVNDLSKLLQDPATKAAADSLLSGLIKAAVDAINFVAQLSGGIRVLLGLGGNAMVDLDTKLTGLQLKKKALEAAFASGTVFPGSAAARDLEEVNKQIDALMVRLQKLQDTPVAVAAVPAALSAAPAGGPHVKTQEELDAIKAANKLKMDEEKKFTDFMADSRGAMSEDLIGITTSMEAEEFKLSEDYNAAKLASHEGYLNDAVKQREDFRDISLMLSQDLLAGEKAAIDAAHTYRSDAANKGLAILQLLGQKNKKLAQAAIIIQAAAGATSILISSFAAAAAALAPPPIGAGPILGIPLAAGIKAWGIADAAATLALGAAQLGTLGGGAGTPNVGGGSAPGSPASVGPQTFGTSRSEEERAKEGTVINLSINGVITHEIVDQFKDSLSDMFGRGVIVIHPSTNQADAIRKGI